MTSVNEIRQEFLDFFAGRGHAVVPSAPLVPQNDPTLMFVNAGMVPFKNLFTGIEHRDYQRATSSQKCVRAGGKHNDLDNVGYTARHHTFFEMLGNFSFGDYFKEEAIDAAWTLVTKNFGLNPDKLLVTVYHTDEEAASWWKKIAGLPDDRIIRIATSDNFWAMGDTGPCGPCSEIFYDHGADIPGGPPGSPEEDGDRFIEIWNLVFMQFETTDDAERIELPRPSIDTGMGLERIAAVLQGVHDNYDIDLFRNLIAASVDLTGKKAQGDMAIAHRVVCDHLRASSFLIADGVTPSNEGRGYVLRRIMRRAMRYAHGLGATDPLMAKLVPVLTKEMGDAYPELRRAESLIIQTLQAEEEKFQSLLGRGLKILDQEKQALAAGEKLSGEAAFKLYDTYGFPLDLTQDAMRREGIGVDTAGFDRAMEAQKQAARASWAGSGAQANEALWFDLRETFGATDFTGYLHDSGEAIIQAIIKQGQTVDTAIAGDEIEFVCNQTPFYAESGGQAGDHGQAETSTGARLTITDTKKRLGALHAHMATVETGTVSLNEVVKLEIDKNRRADIRANHSATHILHTALRTVLGDHVAQKGSLVEADRLRFDFSHPQALTQEELQKITEMVNMVIRQNSEVTTRLMPYEDAIAAGAIALFGEKYEEDVRVLSIGHDLHQQGKDYSVELCGGTHVSHTGDIGLFHIVSESAVASGVRRIEAMTSDHARHFLQSEAEKASAAAGLLKTTPTELLPRLQLLLDERKKQERALTEMRKKLAMTGGGSAPQASMETIGDMTFSGRVLEGIAAKELRGLVDEAKASMQKGVAAFIAVNDGKAAITIGVTADLTDRYSAVDLVKVASQALGGKGGGGRPDMAQAGGPNGQEADKAIAAIRDLLTGA
ncbi:MAG: alanine--tRNA ligase [bacterium]